MPVPKIFKISRKTFLNPSGWIDLESLKDQNRTMYAMLKNIFSPDKPTREETFDQAVTRLELSEKDIKETYARYKRYAIMFLIIGLIIFLYAFYLLFRYFSFTGWLLGLASCALFLSQAFRYDFWAFQIKSRKLGVTFNEWKQSILGAPKHD